MRPERAAERPQSTSWRASALAWGVLLAAYAPTFAFLWREWGSHPYGGHGVFVPAFVAVLLWRDRGALRRSAGPGDRRGAWLLGGAAAFFVAGLFFGRPQWQVLSLLPACAGLVARAHGALSLRRAQVPILLLGLMLPLPRGVARAVTPVLQQAVASHSAHVLSAAGVPIFHDGLRIELASTSLEVAEVCNGLRFFMALLTVAIVLATLAHRSPAAKALVIASSVPVAFAGNVGRVVAIALAVHHLGPEWAGGPRHHALGKVVWLLAVAALVGLSVGLSASGRAARRRRERRTAEPTAGRARELVQGEVA